MKTHFIFLCIIIGSDWANAVTQTSLNQDKPPHIYVVSYKMNDQCSGTYHMETPSTGYSLDQTLTCNANFYGLMDGTNGLIGAGAADFELDQIDVTGGSTLREHMMEQDTNSVPALVDAEYIVYGSNPYYDGTNTYAGLSFPISKVHCDMLINDVINRSNGYEYQNLSLTGSRKAQAVLKLETGGKAKSRLRNLIGLTGSAMQTIPAFPFITAGDWQLYWLADYLGGEYICGTNIPSQDIAIGSYGNLNANGVKYLILPDNADVDVTPYVAGANYYSFNVSVQKYHSNFDVYVEEADPGGILPYSKTNDVGHAWWGLRTDAPQDALVKFLSASNYWVLNYKGISGTQTPGNYGYYPTVSGILYPFVCPGFLDLPEDHTASQATIARTFAIGFDGFENALNFTVSLHANPGTYELLGHNCVQAVRDAAKSAGGYSFSYGGAPQYFGMMLGFMYSTNMQSVFFLP